MAPLWGLARALRAERPDLKVEVLDLALSEVSAGAACVVCVSTESTIAIPRRPVTCGGREPCKVELPALLPLLRQDPELAVREGRRLAPRLADATAAMPEVSPASFEARKWIMVPCTVYRLPES